MGTSGEQDWLQSGPYPGMLGCTHACGPRAGLSWLIFAFPACACAAPAAATAVRACSSTTAGGAR